MGELLLGCVLGSAVVLAAQMIGLHRRTRRRRRHRRPADIAPSRADNPEPAPGQAPRMGTAHVGRCGCDVCMRSELLRALSEEVPPHQILRLSEGGDA